MTRKGVFYVVTLNSDKMKGLLLSGVQPKPDRVYVTDQTKSGNGRQLVFFASAYAAALSLLACGVDDVVLLCKVGFSRRNGRVDELKVTVYMTLPKDGLDLSVLEKEFELIHKQLDELELHKSNA